MSTIESRQTSLRPSLAKARIIMEEESVPRRTNGIASDEPDRVALASRLSSSLKASPQSGAAVYCDTVELPPPSIPGVKSPSNGHKSVFGGNTGASLPATGPRAQPSYLGISCSVSGYGRRGPVGNGTLCEAATTAAHATAAHATAATTAAVASSTNAPNGQLPAANGTLSPVSSRSFVQARIERLYGPGALCSGFRRIDLNRSLPSASVRSAITPHTGNTGAPGSRATAAPGSAQLETVLHHHHQQQQQQDTPPVFRHLRAEFRRQLPAATPRRTLGRTLSAVSSQSVVHPPLVPSPSQPAVPSLPLVPSPSQPVIPHPTLVPSPSQPAVPSLPLVPSSSQPVIPHPPLVPSPSQTVVPPPQLVASTSQELKLVPSVIVNGDQSGVVSEKPVQSPGNSFIQGLDRETTRLLALAAAAEKDLASVQLSPEIEGKFLAAMGKARLLIAQKFQQFRGLCEKNLNQCASDPYPTTVDDLQGFWDMVLIQVEHIDQLMAELDSIRSNNWTLPAETVCDSAKSDITVRRGHTTTTAAATKRTSRHQRSQTTSATPASAAPSTAAATAAAQERRRVLNEKRRALLLARREQLQQQQQQSQTAGAGGTGPPDMMTPDQVNGLMIV